jgi:hypothetical protein
MTSLGYNKPLGETWRWNVDMTASNLGATSTSGGVAATSGTANEYYLYNRFTATELFTKGDVHMFGLRMADSDSYESNRLFLNSRWPAGDKWRINPRLQMDWRDYKSSGDTEQIIEPSLRVEYNWSKMSTLEFDAGLSTSRRTTWVGNQDNQNYYLSIGYRIGF